VKTLLLIAAGIREAEALRRGLRYAPECRVIGFADVRRPCDLVVLDARPDVILVNDAQGDDTTARITEARRAAPDATIICRMRHQDAAWQQAVGQAGANATIDASLEASRMGLLVREISAATVYHTARAVPEQPPKWVESAVAQLTARELEILRLTAAGASNGAIARQLWVTEQTVKFHLSNLYRKLGVANRTEASHFAHINGLLTPAPVQGAQQPSAAVAA
jgi:DNA-binding NarL/FixJ family response regulator